MCASFLPVTPYKGTRDFYPEDMRLRKWFFSRMRNVVERFGYEEYGGPILESFDLYAAKSGEELVNEQIYHFEDKGGRRLAIRPEMTPTVARMVAAKINEWTFPLRWYCIENLMRYERPQKGRLREHWQLNVDIFGEAGVHADLEILMVVRDLLLAFGADASMFKIGVSNRRFFNEVLAEILEVSESEIHVISKAVDKRAKISDEQYRKWISEAGVAEDKIQALDAIFASSLEDLCAKMPETCQGAREVLELFSLIQNTGLEPYVEFDFSIVRGFDYYTGTVFEVSDASPENRRALFGGGRYDNLVGLFKKSDISGIGFGFGDVTFQNFLEIHNLLPESLVKKDKVFIPTFEEVPFAEYFRLSEELHDAGVANNVYLDASAKMKKQMSYAEKQGFSAAIIFGGDELKGGKVVVKNMVTREQTEVSRDACARVVAETLQSALG